MGVRRTPTARELAHLAKQIEQVQRERDWALARLLDQVRPRQYARRTVKGPALAGGNRQYDSAIE